MELTGQEERLVGAIKEMYYLRANECEKRWGRDNAAALKIQSKFKMYIKRKQFLTKKAAATKIQTHFRAYYARKIYRHNKRADLNAKSLSYFAQQAVLIQKVFRGYFVRKLIHNFYMRKKELKDLAEKNEQFRQELNQFGKVQAAQAEQYQQELAKAEFEALAKNLHHLSSTKGIPGVYNSPFALQKPVVFQKTVEQHLKTAFKQSYRWRPPNKQSILKYSIKTAK